MADTALHSLTEKTTLEVDDEFYLVQSPYGTGDDRRASLANVGAYFKIAPAHDSLRVVGAVEAGNALIGPAPNASFPGIWFGTNGNSPSFSNYSVLYNVSTSVLQLNAPTGGHVGIAVPSYLLNGEAAGAAGVQNTLVVRKTGIPDNSATAIITVTVPNSAHNAAIFLDILAHLGTGTDVSESSRCATGVIVLARKSGVDTVAVASALAQAQIATVSGGGTLTLAYSVSSMTGTSAQTQTFSIQLTLVVTGTITDHTAVVSARLLNSLGTGVTMAAA